MSPAVRPARAGPATAAPLNTADWREIAFSRSSRGTSVETGDVLGSGTVGSGCILELSGRHGAERYPWLSPGDEVRLEVEELGAIVSRITEAAPVVPLR